MKVYTNILGLLLMFSATGVVAALPEESGNIIHLQVHNNPNGVPPNDQLVIVRLDSTISVGNNCGTNDQWASYLSNDAEKAQYSTMLALYMAGKPVRVQGTSPDTCINGSLRVRNVYAVSP